MAPISPADREGLVFFGMEFHGGKLVAVGNHRMYSWHRHLKVCSQIFFLFCNLKFVEAMVVVWVLW